MRLQLLLAFVLFGCACAAVVRMKLETRDDILDRPHIRPFRVSNKESINDPIVEADRGIAYTNITVGTPPQQFRVTVDTQEGDLWVFDKSCYNCKADQHLFDSSKSTTFEPTGKPFETRMGSGTHGVIGKDVIGLGGIGKEQIAVHGQVFGQAQEDNYHGCDGVLGLAFPPNAIDGLYPPLSNAINQGVLDEPIFTLYIDRQNANGMVTYGGLDTMNCGDVLGYIPLVKATGWFFRIDGVSVKDFSSHVGWQVMENSFSDIMIGPGGIVDGIAAQIGATVDPYNRAWVVDCDAILPTVRFYLGSFAIDVEPDSYTRKECLEGKRQLTFMSAPVAAWQTWTLGTSFMKGHCIVHDMGAQRIGFAEPKIPNH